jgi:hypothetical protein
MPQGLAPRLAIGIVEGPLAQANSPVPEPFTIAIVVKCRSMENAAVVPDSCTL